MSFRNSKIIAASVITMIYLLAFIVIYFIFPIIPAYNSMIQVLIADILATILVFIFSVILRNSSVYDAYWSVIPPFIVVYLMTIFPEGNQ